ncbi:MAG TPA: BLUF domain-containing protein [Arenibaculum sp.]|nr:BLUF domain-containing protein [Arenibaculum sp.]
MLTCLVYGSTAVAPLTEDELLELLRRSRRDNQAADITGLLLYMGGSFMQALEGDRQAVQDLYERIRRDRRHTGVTTLIRFSVPGRAFSDWSMAFGDMDRLRAEDRAGFSSFLEPSFTDPAYVEGPHRAVKLLERFRDTMMKKAAPPVQWWY